MGEGGANVERREMRGTEGMRENIYTWPRTYQFNGYMEFNSVLFTYSQQIQRQQVEPNYYPNG